MVVTPQAAMFRRNLLPQLFDYFFLEEGGFPLPV
jgi:hypothetical protein